MDGKLVACTVEPLLKDCVLCMAFKRGSNTGTPNNQMFPDTLALFQIIKYFLYALGAYLVNLELPLKRFICLDVLKVLGGFLSDPKLLAALMDLIEEME